MTHQEQELADAYAAGVEAGRKLGRYRQGVSSGRGTLVGLVLLFGGALLWLVELSK